MPEINVSEELKEHYEAVKHTRDSIIEDFNSSGSEKAAILNATTSVLKDLVKLMKEAYNADTISMIRESIVEGLDDADQQLKQKVLDILEEKLARLQ